MRNNHFRNLHRRFKEMAETMLLGVLGKDFGDGVFKYLAPRTLARLETTDTLTFNLFSMCHLYATNH